MPGKIVRVVSEPYDFTVPETGEVITLCHSYVYQPEEFPEATVFRPEPSKSDYIMDEIMSQIGD